MWNKFKLLAEKYRDVLSYLFFGVLTTVVNYIIYLPLLNVVRLSGAVSNVIAWIGAVIFAFATNKPLVFKSYDWSPKVLFPEIGKFLSCRVGSGLIETGIIAVTVDILHWNGNVMKLITSVLVVIINYIGSKLLVFKKKN